MPEVIVLAIAWLISVSHHGWGVFTGLSLVYWNVAGAVSCVRMFDLVAAVGIGSTPISRLIAIWFGRIALVLAIAFRLYGVALAYAIH